ncbi:MAG: heparinase II/III family protein [Aestuariivirga sp.]|nr:heparinase II/III family protein [Aestuariivirga sp.]
MRDHWATQQLGTPTYFQVLSGHGSTLKHWASHGLGLGSSQRISISGLGTRLLALKPGDPTMAQDMARGKFSFAGATVTGIPVDVFDANPPSAEWAIALHNLSWLQHFVTGGHELHRIVARSLVLKWGEQRGGIRTPMVCFQALISLASAAHFLLGPSPSSFGKPFYELVEKLIHRVLANHPSALSDSFWQAVALQYASLAFRGSETLRDQANARLCTVMDQVILSDGGHVSRNPQALLEVLLAVIPIRDAMVAKREAVPQALSAAIERMFPMLRMLSHGDRGLGNFQGAGASEMAGIKTLVEHDTIAGRPLHCAPHSGYCRLSHRSGLLIMDTGIPGECNSPLAIEFSDGPHRIFNNCGMPDSATDDWRRAAADIAAHNTVEITSFESGVKNNPTAEVIASPQGSLINCSNEISGRSGRVIHHRSIFLSQTGNDLRGEDRISTAGSPNSPAGPLDFTIRFHLHPGVKATLTRKEMRIVLMLPNKTAWQFNARGGIMSLEDSVFLGDALGPRKTQQIVIRGSTETADPVNWALRRVEKSAASPNDRVEMPQLPF